VYSLRRSIAIAKTNQGWNLRSKFIRWIDDLGKWQFQLGRAGDENGEAPDRVRHEAGDRRNLGKLPDFFVNGKKKAAKFVGIRSGRPCILGTSR